MRAKDKDGQGSDQGRNQCRKCATVLVSSWMTGNRVFSGYIAAPSSTGIFSSSNEAGYSTAPGCLQDMPRNFRILATSLRGPWPAGPSSSYAATTGKSAP